MENTLNVAQPGASLLPWPKLEGDISGVLIYEI